MIDLAGVGTLLTGIGTLVATLKIHSRTSTGNGKSIGHMVAETHAMTETAEPHHHRDDPE